MRRCMGRSINLQNRIIMKKVTLQPFKVNIRINGYWKGLLLKRDLTINEALYIADYALRINVTLIKGDWKSRIKEEREDVYEEKEEFRSDIQGLITGDNHWDAFANRWTCDEGMDDICPAMFIQMLYICQQKGLID